MGKYIIVSSQNAVPYSNENEQNTVPNNLEGSDKHKWWVKESRYKSLHIKWVYVSKVQNREKWLVLWEVNIVVVVTGGGIWGTSDAGNLIMPVMGVH